MALTSGFEDGIWSGDTEIVLVPAPPAQVLRTVTNFRVVNIDSANMVVNVEVNNAAAVGLDTERLRPYPDLTVEPNEVFHDVSRIVTLDESRSLIGWLDAEPTDDYVVLSWFVSWVDEAI